MGRRFEVLSPQQALGMVWRREFKIAAALLSAASDLGDPEISLVPDAVDLKDGDWVTLNALGEIIKVVAPTPLAWTVYTGGVRFDVRASQTATVLFGQYVARTAAIKPAIVVNAGALLTVRDGLLDLAAVGEPVLALAEKPKEAGTAEFPDGFITYTTMVNSVRHA